MSVDQSSGSNFDKSDLLLATTEASGDTSPALEFKHALSSIVINDIDPSVSGGVITVLAQSKVTLNTTKGTYTTDETLNNITPASNGEESYKAIVVPQTIKAGETVATYEIDGVTYKWTANSDMTFKSGYRSTYDWDVSSNTVTYVGSVEGWNDNNVDDSKTEYEWNEKKYTPIDFDAVYGTGYSGSTLITKIGEAIADAEDDEIIVFKSDSYDFEKQRLLISTPARLSGKIPSDIDGSVIGAQNVTTYFENVGRIQISCNDVEIYNVGVDGEDTTYYGLIYIGDSASNAFFTSNTEWRTGLVFSNVELLYADILVNAGNGAGATFKQVSFIDYNSLGYMTNRTAALDVCPQSIFSYCLFQAPGDAYYDMRGISLDCGNTDYPITLDLSGTLIENCYFYRGGIAYSKCKNSSIKNCTFFSNSMEMDQVHIEEFSSDIDVTYNTFIHDEPSRCFYLDRGERQTVSDITITNNKYIGEVGWIISSYSPRNITFTNNDFTEATFSWDSWYNYDLDFCHYTSTTETDCVGYEYPSYNVVIKDNPGLTTSGGGIRIYVEAGNNTNDIDVITAADITEVPPASESRPIKFSQCYIKNLGTGEYISYGDSGDYVGLSQTAAAECIWNVEFRDPQNYNFTTSSGLYLETYIIFTLSNLRLGSDPGDTLARKSSYDSSGSVPSFVLQHPEDTSYSDYYMIFPGQNECKSALAVIDNAVDIGYGKVSYNNDDVYESNVYKDPALYTNYLWEIIEVK